MSESDSDNLGVSCGFCKKPAINKKVKCTNCMQVFHSSCSIKKTKKCCDKQSYLEEQKTLSTDETELNTLSDELNVKPVTNEIQILKGMNSDLRVNIKLLKEKIANLEEENFNLKEEINKNQEQIPTSQDTIIKLINKTIKIELENNLKPFKTEINNLNKKINKLEEINLKSTIKKPTNKLPTADKQQSTLTAMNKIPVSPKQYSQQLISRLPKQNIPLTLEQQQRKVMNELIHIDSDQPLAQEYIPSEMGSETEKWQTVHGRKKSFKRNIGQSEANNEKFTGVKPKVWLYLYRITPDVVEEDIRQYLKIKTDNKNEEFIVKDLKESGSSRFKTFMVAGDFKYKEAFYEPSFWPKGVFFRRFDFNKHFEKHKTRHIINNENDDRPNSFLEVAP